MESIWIAILFYAGLKIYVLKITPSRWLPFRRKHSSSRDVKLFMIAYSSPIIASIQSLNDLDLVRVVVKIVVMNSSHGSGSYSKSGCVSHGRSARTSVKRLSNPPNVLWSSHSFLTATSFFRCWSTHLKVGYPCFYRMVWWNRLVTRNIEMSAEYAPSPHQTLAILIISLNGKSTLLTRPLLHCY